MTMTTTLKKSPERPTPFIYSLFFLSPFLIALSTLQLGQQPLAYSSPEGFGLGLLPFHSQLLGESLLISFPPLNNMLNFSGWTPRTQKLFFILNTLQRRRVLRQGEETKAWESRFVFWIILRAHPVKRRLGIYYSALGSLLFLFLLFPFFPMDDYDQLLLCVIFPKQGAIFRKPDGTCEEEFFVSNGP